MTPINTQQILPWPETVVHVSTVTGANVTTTVTSAGVYQISLAEAAKSYGAYQTGDIRVTFSTDDVSAPKPRDTVTHGGVDYVVIDAKKAPYLKFHKLTCRNLKIAADLQHLADIYAPTATPTETGLRSHTEAVVYTDVPCRMQPDETSMEIDNEETGRVTTRKKYVCYLGTNYSVSSGYILTLVIESHTVKYRVLSSNNTESITGLQELQCEVIE